MTLMLRACILAPAMRGTAISTARPKRQFRAYSQRYSIAGSVSNVGYVSFRPEGKGTTPIANGLTGASTATNFSSLTARAHTIVSPLRINHAKFSRTLGKVCGSSTKLRAPAVPFEVPSNWLNLQRYVAASHPSVLAINRMAIAALRGSQQMLLVIKQIRRRLGDRRPVTPTWDCKCGVAGPASYQRFPWRGALARVARRDQD
jgi:hypothetical protein